MPPRSKTNHIITDITFTPIHIVCVCKWEGDDEEYEEHKKIAPKLPAKEVKDWKVIYKYREPHMNPKVMAIEVDFLDELIK